MEDPIPYIAIGSTQTDQETIKKAKADLALLDKQAVQLEGALHRFSQEHFFCELPLQTPEHVRRLRTVFATWTRFLQEILPHK